MAFWDHSRRHGRRNGAVEENCGGWDVAYVADGGCFVDVDRDRRVEVVVVVVGAVYVDGVAWGQGLRDCSVGYCGVSYSYRVGVVVVGSCSCGC